MSWFSEPIRLSVEGRCRAAWSMLAISWLALTVTAVDILVSTHAGAKAEEAGDGEST